MISVFDVVVGDILLLEPGDIVSADGVFLEGHNLKCDESNATGESDAVKKGPGQDPFLLSGTKVLEGVGKYVVIAVGEKSFQGKIMLGKVLPLFGFFLLPRFYPSRKIWVNSFIIFFYHL